MTSIKRFFSLLVVGLAIFCWTGSVFAEEQKRKGMPVIRHDPFKRLTKVVEVSKKTATSFNKEKEKKETTLIKAVSSIGLGKGQFALAIIGCRNRNAL